MVFSILLLAADVNVNILYCLQDLQCKHQALEAFKETVTVFEEQLKLHDNYQRHAAAHEVAK